MRIIFATGNEGKMREIRMIMADLGLEILSMKEAGLYADVDENGTTFEENAVIKAKGIAALCDDIVLADDSGLEIDALNKEPGVYSARYMGEDTSIILKMQIWWNVWKVYLTKNVRHVSCVPLQRYYRMEECWKQEKPLKEESDTKNVEKMDLVMIRFLCFHSMENPQQKFRLN